MHPRDKLILENLAAGKYDGTFLEGKSYGSVKNGMGRIDKGMYIEDGKVIEYKDRTTKFFDGHENERETTRETYVADTPEQILEVLGRYGYRMYDFDEVRGYSKWWLDKRDYENRKLAELQAEIERNEKPVENVPELTEPEGYENEHSPKMIPLNFEELGLSEEEKTKAEADIIKILKPLGVVAVVGGTVWISVKAFPKVKAWVTTRVLPSVKEFWRRLTRSGNKIEAQDEFQSMQNHEEVDKDLNAVDALTIEDVDVEQDEIKE